jgi:hypothetical protein
MIPMSFVVRTRWSTTLKHGGVKDRTATTYSLAMLLFRMTPRRFPSLNQSYSEPFLCYFEIVSQQESEVGDIDRGNVVCIILPNFLVNLRSNP